MNETIHQLDRQHRRAMIKGDDAKALVAIESLIMNDQLTDHQLEHYVTQKDHLQHHIKQKSRNWLLRVLHAIERRGKVPGDV